MTNELSLPFMKLTGVTFMVALKKSTLATEQKKLVSEIRLLLQRRFDSQHKRRWLEEGWYYVYSMPLFSAPKA